MCIISKKNSSAQKIITLDTTHFYSININNEIVGRNITEIKTNRNVSIINNTIHRTMQDSSEADILLTINKLITTVDLEG